MKKIFAVFLIAIMCVTLFACGAGKESQNTGSRPENTTPDDTSKKLSEAGEMNFALVSDNGREIAPYKFYYGGQLYGSGNEITYFGTGKLLGFDVKELIEEIPGVTVKNGFSVRTDKNVEVYNTVSVFDSDGKEIYSGDVSVGNIKSVSDGKNCIVQLTAKRSGEGRYSDEYSMYLMLIKLAFE